MTSPVIETYPGVGDHAFSSMMLELIRTNLADRPEKLRDFAGMRGRVALIAEDADTAVTLRFQRGKLTVHQGMHGVPDLVVRGPSDALIDMSRIPTLERAPFLPDVRSDAARSIARALREKRLKIRGALRHPGLAVRLSRVLSIY